MNECSTIDARSLAAGRLAVILFTRHGASTHYYTIIMTLFLLPNPWHFVVPQSCALPGGRRDFNVVWCRYCHPASRATVKIRPSRRHPPRVLFSVAAALMHACVCKINARRWRGTRFGWVCRFRRQKVKKIPGSFPDKSLRRFVRFRLSGSVFGV